MIVQKNLQDDVLNILTQLSGLSKGLLRAAGRHRRRLGRYYTKT